MVATELALRLVPLLFPCWSPAVRGQAPRWNEMHSRSYALREAQVQGFKTEPASGWAHTRAQRVTSRIA